MRLGERGTPPTKGELCNSGDGNSCTIGGEDTLGR